MARTTLLERPKSARVDRTIAHGLAVVSIEKVTAPRPPSRAVLAWQTLPAECKEAWKQHAALLQRYDPSLRKVVRTNGRATFIREANRLWKLDSDLSAPIQPLPPFLGDHVGLIARSRKKRAIRFEATGRNEANVVTEILVQRLKSIEDAPRPKRFRTMKYAFLTGATVESSMRKGVYATAYRFIDLTTLAASPIQEAGIVAVGKPKPAAKPVDDYFALRYRLQ